MSLFNWLENSLSGNFCNFKNCYYKTMPASQRKPVGGKLLAHSLVCQSHGS